MRRYYSAMLFVVFAAAACAVWAVGITGEQVVAAVKSRFAPIKDYKTDITMNLKGPGVSINNMKMTLYFKKPNKIHIDAREGMGMVPPGNYFGNPIDELTKNKKAVYLRSEKRNKANCNVVRLDPAQKQSNDACMLVWVDKARNVIVAVECPDHGLKSNWSYTKVDGKYYLPSQISAEMDAPSQSGKPQKATTTIKFANYQVNKGISDKVFEPKPAKK